MALRVPGFESRCTLALSLSAVLILCASSLACGGLAQSSTTDAGRDSTLEHPAESGAADAGEQPEAALDGGGTTYSKCEATAAGTYAPTNAGDAPEGRFQHAMVWTGAEMLTWGGLGFEQPDGGMCTTCTCFDTELNTGGRYEPATDSWLPMTSQGAPEPRAQPAAVWTGTEMIVWGGVSLTYAGCASPTFVSHDTGGRYNPVTDTWLPTSTVGAPAPRFFAPAIYTGHEMIVWGGTDYGPQGPFQTGGRYDPATDSWRPTSLEGAPSGRYGHALAWTGKQVVVWGGYGAVKGQYVFHNDGALYDPVSDHWTPMSQKGAPQPRQNAQAFWMGTELLVIGCCDNDGASLTGGRYDPATDSWSAIEPPCDRRSGALAFYTGTELVAIGGSIMQRPDECSENCSSIPQHSILRYSPISDTWREAPTNIDITRLSHQLGSVWTGTELLVWGGEALSGLGGVNTGWRYEP